MPLSITLDNKCHYNKKESIIDGLGTNTQGTGALLSSCSMRVLEEGPSSHKEECTLSLTASWSWITPYCEALVHTLLSEVTCHMQWEFSPCGKILSEWNLTPCVTSRVLHRGGKMFLCRSVFFTWWLMPGRVYTQPNRKVEMLSATSPAWQLICPLWPFSILFTKGKHILKPLFCLIKSA